MKTASLTLDQTLYQLLVQKRFLHFTIPELRDRYAETLSGKRFELTKLRVHIYEQVRKMMRVGWVTQDPERKKRGQVFHLQRKPRNLEIELVVLDFPADQKPPESIADSENSTEEQDSKLTIPNDRLPPADDVIKLRGMLKEVKLDFLTQVGQTERFSELMKEVPSLKEDLEAEFLASRDASSRLLGHVQALEVALKKLEH